MRDPPVRAIKLPQMIRKSFFFFFNLFFFFFFQFDKYNPPNTALLCTKRLRYSSKSNWEMPDLSHICLKSELVELKRLRGVSNSLIEPSSMTMIRS